MKLLYVTLFLLSISASFGSSTEVNKADKGVPGVGGHSGDPCYCVTCIGNNKCAGNRANSDRKVVVKPERGTASRNKNRGSKVGEI